MSLGAVWISCRLMVSLEWCLVCVSNWIHLGSGFPRQGLGRLSLCRRALQKDQKCELKGRVQIPAFSLPPHPQQCPGTYPDKHFTGDSTAGGAWPESLGLSRTGTWRRSLVLPYAYPAAKNNMAVYVITPRPQPAAHMLSDQDNV